MKINKTVAKKILSRDISKWKRILLFHELAVKSDNQWLLGKRTGGQQQRKQIKHGGQRNNNNHKDRSGILSRVFQKRNFFIANEIAVRKRKKNRIAQLVTKN